MRRNKSGNLGRVVSGLAAFAVVSASTAALACPVCFGMLEGPVADATNKAVLAMLGVTGAVLVAFAAFFVYLFRRARAMAAPEVRVEGTVMERTV